LDQQPSGLTNPISRLIRGRCSLATHDKVNVGTERAFWTRFFSDVHQTVMAALNVMAAVAPMPRRKLSETRRVLAGLQVCGRSFDFVVKARSTHIRWLPCGGRTNVPHLTALASGGRDHPSFAAD
jgi:hypothetical protein